MNRRKFLSLTSAGAATGRAAMQKDPRWLGYWASFGVDHFSELPRVSGDMRLLEPR